MDTVDLGASIACSGVCLTVVDKGDDWFAVDVSGETVSRTAADHWREGARLNLERSLRLGDELGGHIVTGHVDAVGEVVGSLPRRRFEAQSASACRARSAPMIAAKGSIALDGVSMTVNEVRDADDGTHPFLRQRHPAYGAAYDTRRARAGTTIQCRGRRACALYRSDARRPRTLGTSLFLLFITSQCDIRRR